MKNIKGTFVTGGVTYNFEAVMPESLMFIYSPHIYTYLKIMDTDGRAVPGMRVQSVIMGRDTSTNEYRYTDANGMVRFDIARILQMMTDDRGQELDNIDYERNQFASWITGRITLMFYVDGVRVAAVLSQYLNGSHFTAQDWWANERRLKWWSSYPFTFDFVNTEQIKVSINNGVYNVVDIPYVATDMKLINRVTSYVLGADTFTRRVRIKSDITRDYSRAFSSAYAIYENKAGWGVVEGLIDEDVVNVLSLEVDNCPMSDNRTYMRWLGKHGEVYYWLFFNYAEEIKVESELFKTSVTDDMFRGNETNKILGNGVMKISDTTMARTIFTEPIDDYYYDYVIQMAESPYVDMYLGNDKWQRVIVRDASFVKSLKGSDRQKKHQLSFTVEIGG